MPVFDDLVILKSRVSSPLFISRLRRKFRKRNPRFVSKKMRRTLFHESVTNRANMLLRQNPEMPRPVLRRKPHAQSSTHHNRHSNYVLKRTIIRANSYLNPVRRASLFSHRIAFQELQDIKKTAKKHKKRAVDQ
jgi:hypothetical protein